MPHTCIDVNEYSILARKFFQFETRLETRSKFSLSIHGIKGIISFEKILLLKNYSKLEKYLRVILDTILTRLKFFKIIRLILTRNSFFIILDSILEIGTR